MFMGVRSAAQICGAVGRKIGSMEIWKGDLYGTTGDPTIGRFLVFLLACICYYCCSCCAQGRLPPCSQLQPRTTMKGVMSLQVCRAASLRARQMLLLPVGGLVGAVSRRPVSSSAPPQQKKQHVSFKDMVYGNPLGLPRLPIPKLEDTVSRYLKVRPCLQRVR